MTTDTIEAPTAADQAAEDAAFTEAASQLTGTPIEPPTTPTAPPAEAPADAPAAVPATPVVEDVPDVVKLTKAQFNDLMDVVQMKADLQKSVAMRGKLEEGFGTLGELKQTLARMQQSGGQGLTVAKEDFAELIKAEFPEFANYLTQGLNRIFGRMPKGGGVDVKKALTELQPELLDAAEHRARNAACQEYLEDEHPGWADVVGRVTVDAHGNAVIPDTEFRRWAAKTYPKEQHDRIFASKNGPMLAKVIERFKNEAAKAKEPVKPDPKALERKERVAAAVQPNSLPATGAPQKSEEDEFTAAGNETLRSRGLV